LEEAIRSEVAQITSKLSLNHAQKGNTMNRNLESALALGTVFAAAAVAAAAIASGNAYADDITIDKTPVPQVKNAYTSEQAKAEYKASRQFVSALTGEDSGSAYFIKAPVPSGANSATTMGGPAR
jgi:hypothetical protein